ncbi:MAG TPA: hypothetical protein VMY78_16640 [Solirubrobacteraceae bacterium]|nr:hypothetical protein [Solirubrobacteraceae bacterium]
MTQEDFERAVTHCTAQLAEHELGIDEQLAALGLEPEGIATLAEAVPWAGIETPEGVRSAALALRMGVLIGAQLQHEGLLGAGV